MIIIVTHIGRPHAQLRIWPDIAHAIVRMAMSPLKGYTLSDMDFAPPSFPVWTACGRNSISRVVPASCCGCWSHVVLVVCFSKSERSNARGSSGGVC